MSVASTTGISRPTEHVVFVRDATGLLASAAQEPVVCRSDNGLTIEVTADGERYRIRFVDVDSTEHALDALSFSKATTRLEYLLTHGTAWR